MKKCDSKRKRLIFCQGQDLQHSKLIEENQESYLSVITINKSDYLITTSEKDKSINVREITKDIEEPGIYCVYANEQLSKACLFLKKYLNMPRIATKIEAGVSMSIIVQSIIDSYLKNRSSQEIIVKEPIKTTLSNFDMPTIVVSISSDLFSHNKALLDQASSMSRLQLAALAFERQNVSQKGLQ